MNNKQKTSSRNVGMRDINVALLSTSISRIKTLQNDEGLRGFTLVELLIVILIIAILAAIAVPQYQQAVLKSRYTSLKIAARALAEAEERYYLEHGKYTQNIAELDLTFTDPIQKIKHPYTYETMYYFSNGWQVCSIFTNYPRLGCGYFQQNTNIISYSYDLQHCDPKQGKPGKKRCVIYKNTGLPKQICQQETGSTKADTSRGNFSYWYP